ncbi:MAG: M48 family metalloprotease [Terracidiphilus sp.]
MNAWTRREWLYRTGIGAAGLAAVRVGALSALADEPRVTISPLNKLTDEDEIALGRRFAAQVESEVEIVSNPVIEHYLGKMISALAAQSQRPNLPYSIKLINSHEANAFSIPGGFLYLNRGLVELIAEEDELAATLGHEIGHVVARHVVNELLMSFAAQSVLKPVLDNLDKQNGVVDQIIRKLGGAFAMLAMLHFSREDEAEADLLGFYEMLRAGWDPHGFLELFDQLKQLEKQLGGAPNRFLSDHPPTPQRAAAIEHELKKVKIPANARKDSLTFQVFKSTMGLLPEPAKSQPHRRQE